LKDINSLKLVLDNLRVAVLFQKKYILAMET